MEITAFKENSTMEHLIFRIHTHTLVTDNGKTILGEVNLSKRSEVNINGTILAYWLNVGRLYEKKEN